MNTKQDRDQAKTLLRLQRFPSLVQRESKAIHLHCLISKETQKVKKHKIFNMQKIVSFRPAMIKKRGKQREAHYNFSSSKKLKIFLDSCYDEVCC